MGILFARAPIGVFLWAYPLVCARQNMAVLSAQGSVLLLEILCCVEGGLRNLRKKSLRRVAFEVLELAMAWKIVSV